MDLPSIGFELQVPPVCLPLPIIKARFHSLKFSLANPLTTSAKADRPGNRRRNQSPTGLPAGTSTTQSGELP
jgi:hypothetical protein